MTDMKTLLIETPIDELIDIVKREKKVTMSRAASLLGVDEKQLEEWVRILEEHGFVELRYPAIGEPEITLKEIPEGKIVEKEIILEKKKVKVEKKAKEFEKKTIEVEKKVEVSDKSLSGLEKELQEKLEDVEKGLQRLEKYESEKEKVLLEARELGTLTQEYAKHFENVKTTLEEIDQKISEEFKRLRGHENEIKNLDEEREKLKTEIMILEKEMHILHSLIRRPIRIPLLADVKKLFEIHARRAKEVKAKKNVLNGKIKKAKEKIKKKKRIFRNHIKKMKHKKKILKLKPIKYKGKVVWKS